MRQATVPCRLARRPLFLIRSLLKSVCKQPDALTRARASRLAPPWARRLFALPKVPRRPCGQPCRLLGLTHALESAVGYRKLPVRTRSAEIHAGVSRFSRADTAGQFCLRIDANDPDAMETTRMPPSRGWPRTTVIGLYGHPHR